MNTLRSLILTIAISAIFSTIVGAQYDDVYYDPNDDATLNQSGDFEEDYYYENEQTQNYNDGYGTEGDRYNQPSNSETYYDEEGNTYITNNYNDDYYDYSYSSRLRRFYDPMPGFGYYSNVYTDPFFYNYDPFFYGSNIYATAGWWRPGIRVNIGWGWGFPGTYYGFYRPWRPFPYYQPFYAYNPWGGWGYNNGFNNGYAAGYFDGLYGNPYSPYYCPVTGAFSPGYSANGNVYYGPRNGRLASNNNGGSFSQEALNDKRNKMGSSYNPEKTGNAFNEQQSGNSVPPKGVKTNSNSNTVRDPNGGNDYVKQRDLNSKGGDSRSDSRSMDSKFPSGKEYSSPPKATQQPTRVKSPTYTPVNRSNPKSTVSPSQRNNTPNSVKPVQRNTAPKSINKGSRSPQYNNPKSTAPVKRSRSSYTKPKSNRGNYSAPKQNFNNRSKSYSKPKSYSAPKNNKWSAPKSSGSRSNFSAPKNNFRSGSSGRSFSKPSNSFKSPKK